MATQPIDYAALAKQYGGQSQTGYSDVLQAVGEKYPALAKHVQNTIVQDAKPPKGADYGLETYPPWESENPNPGKTTIELYRNFDRSKLPEVIAGDLIHVAGGIDPRTGSPVDPTYHSLKDQVKASRTPQQDALDHKVWEQDKKNGEKRPFDQWFDESRGEAYVRGLLFPDDRDEWRKQGVYSSNPKLKSTIEQIGNYLTTGKSASPPMANHSPVQSDAKPDYAALAQKFGATGYEAPEKPRQQGPTERFARSFNRAVTGAEDPSQFIDQAKQQIGQTVGKVADTLMQHPVQAIAAPFMGVAGVPGAMDALKGAHQQMSEVWQRAVDDFSKGDVKTAKGLVNYLNAGIHAVESGVPFVGPMLSHADQELAGGNVAGAAGTVAGVAAPMLMGGKGANIAADTGTIEGAAPPVAPKPNSVRAVAAKAARAVSDVVDPDITGVVSPRLAHVQRVLGRAADALEKGAPQPQPEATGPTFDRTVLPEQTAPQRAETLATTQATPPQPGARTIPTAEERQANFEQIKAKRQAMGLEKPEQVATKPEAPAEPALPSEDDVARGMGYKSVQQAQERLGPEAWQQTYQKIAQGDAAQPEVPKAAPPAATAEPAPPKAEVASATLEAKQEAPAETIPNA
jgi:hypothetical protein